MGNERRRILAIDGGGVKGVLPAAFLTAVEEMTGQRIADHFDLIAGTSTGGILALGLGLGLPAREILELYQELGPEVFGGSRSGGRGRAAGQLRALRRWVRPKYDHDKLHAALLGVFGERRLGEARTRLVIPAFDAGLRTVYIFKTSHHSRLEIDYRETVVNVAMATASAPTYFPSWRLLSGARLMDGGIWANNPAGLAAVEAVGMMDWPRTSIYILSLGCTDPVSKVPAGGILQHLKGGAELFMAGQSQASHGTAKILTNHSPRDPRVIRVNPRAAKGQFALDGVDDMPELAALGSTLARQHLTTVRELFLGEPKDEFVPFWGRELRG